MEDPILWKLDLMSLPWYGNEVSDHQYLPVLLAEPWAVGSLSPLGCRLSVSIGL